MVYKTGNDFLTWAYGKLIKINKIKACYSEFESPIQSYFVSIPHLSLSQVRSGMIPCLKRC